MLSEVSPTIDAPARSSTPNSGSAAMICGSRIRMMCIALRSQKNRQLSERAPDVARADGQHGVARPRFAHQQLDAFLHRAAVGNILVPGGADRLGKGLAGDA